MPQNVSTAMRVNSADFIKIVKIPQRFLVSCVVTLIVSQNLVPEKKKYTLIKEVFLLSRKSLFNCNIINSIASDMIQH